MFSLARRGRGSPAQYSEEVFNGLLVAADVLQLRGRPLSRVKLHMRVGVQVARLRHPVEVMLQLRRGVLLLGGRMHGLVVLEVEGRKLQSHPVLLQRLQQEGPVRAQVLGRAAQGIDVGAHGFQHEFSVASQLWVRLVQGVTILLNGEHHELFVLPKVGMGKFERHVITQDGLAHDQAVPLELRRTILQREPVLPHSCQHEVAIVA
mmetsp:Transcript_126888/g.406313  ORF Transcript_126888/g.406313 Transcript_126888/m.406313 type:complete len:206 (+) Transcript_126888:461-1078(+)